MNGLGANPRRAAHDSGGSGALLGSMLAMRLGGAARDWLRAAAAEVAGGVSDDRFASLLSLASRHAPRGPLAPSKDERAAAGRVLAGWDPERWSVLETVRVALILARSDLAEASGERALEEAFRYADEGEARALLRSMAHLPEPARFAWRVGEGCRTNIVPVFEAAACDTPYPFRWFDDDAWNQLVIKAVFIGAPLWRVFGLDRRLSSELARMALDLADERRSAGRLVPHELWLAMGPHGGERALASLERELDPANPHTLGRRAAAIALVRAGAERLVASQLEREEDPRVRETLRRATSGEPEAASQTAFRALDPRETP